MGTIASVLQWTCYQCNVINPTESLKCLNCGSVRKVCEETLENNDSTSFGLSNKKSSSAGAIKSKEPATPGDNESSNTTLCNKQRTQMQLRQIPPTQQVEPLVPQAVEVERDDTLANRFVFSFRAVLPRINFKFAE